MNNKRFFLTFAGFGIFICSFSWWGYDAYMAVPDRSIFMQKAIKVVLSLALAHFTCQIVLLKKAKAKTGQILTKVVSDVIGFAFLGFYVLLISTIRDNRWGLLSDFFKGATTYTFKTLIPVIMAGEGLDIAFFFFTALISGYLVYSPMIKVGTREFIKALGIWFIIIFINEMVIQRFFLSDARTGCMYDVLNNMVGGVFVGLVLSRRWVWQKR